MFELNRSTRHGQALSAGTIQAFGPEGVAQVVQTMALHPSYRPTPLHDFGDLAQHLGVAAVELKDESGRFGLGSFKALGGAYAVVRIAQQHLQRELGRAVAPQELLDPNLRSRLRLLTVGCATDGNHGKSVAAGANLLGLRARIYVHEGVSPERVEAIARYGAEMVVVQGNYDDAVRFATAECEAHAWTIVSDTSWEGYEDIPRMVMQGYTAMVHELKSQLRGKPTHVFLQAGVGGFAAAMAAAIALNIHAQARFVIVEPERAACLFASNLAGECVTVPAQDATVMSMLECYRPSDIAWDVLTQLATAYMTIGEDEAVEAMRTLARAGAEAGLVSGESGAAGAGGLLAACRAPAVRSALGLDASSRVLLFSTEGATAPAIYQALMRDASRAAEPAEVR
ncbi:MAG TPA: diaminopropionate ammonia-lyase [Pseudorhodoferax sp.]|nr:diaminopropionate ammonia-lyase [Pseudorhodoferax sp.]